MSTANGSADARQRRSFASSLSLLRTTPQFPPGESLLIIIPVYCRSPRCRVDNERKIIERWAIIKCRNVYAAQKLVSSAASLAVLSKCRSSWRTRTPWDLIRGLILIHVRRLTGFLVSFLFLFYLKCHTERCFNLITRNAYLALDIYVQNTDP